MTRAQLLEARAANAGFMHESAQSLENGSIGVKTVTALEVVTPAERKVLAKAEKMALKAANITRRVANRMEQVK